MKRLLCAVALLAATVAPARATPLSDVASAMTALAHATAFHLAFSSHGKTGNVDFVRPGKAHITVGSFEVIKIDTTTYVKTGRSWRQFTIPGMGRISSMYESAIRTASHPGNDMVVVDLGTKIVDGVSLHAYTFKHKDQAVPTILYIDDKGLPARVDTGDGSVVRFSNINGPIAVDAPVM